MAELRDPPCECESMQTARLRSIFHETLGVSSGAALDKDGLMRSAQAAGIPLHSDSAARLMARYDIDGNGLVEEWEFIESMFEREREIDISFHKWQQRAGSAKDGGGFLTSGLRQTIRGLNLTISDAELRNFAEVIDLDHDGVVTLDEFRRFAVFLPTVNPRACFEDIEGHYLEHGDGHHSPAPASHRGVGFEVLAEKLATAGIAGTASRTATAPIDRVKVIMQAGKSNSGGIVAALRGIYASGGWRALFQGNGANCMKVAPETAIKFVAFDTFRDAIAVDPGCPTVAERFVAGGAAGAAAQAGIYPMEIAKTRLALANPGTYNGVVGCLRQVAMNEGTRGLFAGLGASIAGIVPYAAIDLAVFSLLKERVSAHHDSSFCEPSVSTLLACGMASSSCAMIATYPLNLVRTRLQAAGLPGATQYSGPIDVVRRVVAADGYTGLYRGITPNMLKVLPATSISYALYNRVTQLLKERRAD